MRGFRLGRVPEIVAGAGRVSSLGGDVARLAGERAPVMLIADPAVSELGLAGRAADAIASSGHTVQRFEDIASGVRESQVAAAARIAREMGARAVVGLGGGSTLDAAKAVAVLGSEEVVVSDYRLAARPMPERRLACLCVPTTAGAGAETTEIAMLTGDNGTVYWYWAGGLKPDFVILDPELSVTLPRGLTAATALDTLVHAIEASTNRNAGVANDVFAIPAIGLVLRHLPGALREPTDIEARQALLLASSLAGMAVDNAGTALAHNIAHALCSLVPVHHGVAAAAAMAATLDWVMQGSEEGFVPVAGAFGLGGDVAALPERFAQVVAQTGVPLSLPEPVDPAHLALRMGAPENAAMRDACVRASSDDDLDRLAARVVDFMSGTAATTRS